MSLTTKVLLALCAGLVAGLLIQPLAAGAPFAQVLVASEAVGTLWVNAIRMTVVPLVVSLLVTGVSTAADARIVRSVGVRALVTFIGLLTLSLIVGLLYVPLLFTWLEIDPATSEALRASALQGAREVGAAAQSIPTFSQFLVNLVPTNPVKAAADGAMLPLVVFAIAFGLALIKVDDEVRAPVLGFFRAVRDATLVVVRWMIAIAPIGVFALMLPLVSRAGLQTAGALTYYVIAMAIACASFTLLLYPTVALLGRVSMREFARAVFPAQAVAVSTRSSLASLPALVEGAEQRLQLPKSVSSVALPLAVSTFKVTSPIVWTVAALFLARLYGVELSTAARLSIALTAMLSSFSVPGIPHGWLLLISPLLAANGIPVEGIALLFAVDVIPDMFATTTNVTADMVAATIVARDRDDR
ncbi:MAG: dicarboxylate/amino acid:cation symporter [Cytophagaceae bacterium]|nr:dicarboxylate/amino acid:cation symporter [Gemmatimonadaceae bacterium]